MIALFVRKSAAVFTLCVIIVILGTTSYLALPPESAPEIKRPVIFVTTAYPGVSAKNIESLVTEKIEDEIEGLEGVDEITSSSQQSLSFIAVEFTADTDVETALRRVRERVDIAKAELPDEAEEPEVAELSFSNLPILIVAVSHPDGLEVINESALDVKDRLEEIDGVLEVRTAGDLEKQVAVDLDPGALEHYGYDLTSIIGAVQQENVTIPGGILETPILNYSLSVSGELEEPEKFKEIVVQADDIKVKLGKLGTTAFTYEDPSSYSRLNGNPCLTLAVTKRTGESVVRIVDEAKRVLGELEPTLPRGARLEIFYDDSETIRDMVIDLENNIFTALVLVLVVTVFFLGPVNALFVSLAIPLSMLMSFIALQAADITLNMVVLFSLVLALGMLVDNGIVIVENIYRHASMGKGRTQAAVDGVAEVAAPVTVSTLTTVLAFVPIVFMPGIVGEFMSFLPKTVIIVLTSSLIVALAINPVFCARFLRMSESERKRISRGGSSFVKLRDWYTVRVRWAVNHAGLVMVAACGVFIVGTGAYALFGRGSIFFPDVPPRDAVIAIEAAPGTPLERTDSLVRVIEKVIPTIPASLANYLATSGQGYSDDFFAGAGNESNEGNIRLSFTPFLKRKIEASTTIDSLRSILENLSGATVVVKAIEPGPPTGHAVSYEITGEEYDIMGAIANEMVSMLNTYPSLKLVETNYEGSRPELEVEIDRQKAALFGLSTRDIATTVRNAVTGAIVGDFRRKEEEHDVVVRYQKRFRNSIRELAAIQIVNQNDDSRIALGTLASIRLRSTVGVIKRRNLKRAVEVWADFYEGAEKTADIQEEIRRRVAQLSLPSGYQIQSGAGEEVRVEATQFLLRAFGIAILMIAFALIAQFDSFTQPLIILFALLFSLSGVFLGYVLTAQKFVVIMSGIGCIALAGVVVNNNIVLIDYTNLLVKHGVSWPTAIVDAGRIRLRPVLLTAITTMLGLLPMAFGVSFDFHTFTLQIGSESSFWWRSLAWAMIFGLGFATIVTLVVVPCMLTLVFRLRERVSRSRQQ
ncbi:MAG: AcrB/AcrD/AcrF family protein [Chitinivibrionales bacterium]|nr:AcrB/AcrD/AcrF family protein [Chitinivibrionales bacterium]MBD3358167.1 AcrB/AcrD/AcrF family protein [Chitinivibrionales bacterium]